MITEEQKNKMLHAIGNPKLNKNWKAKTILDKAYRNRFITFNFDKSWEDLIEKGFAGKCVNKLINKDEICYYVTEKGIEFLKEEECKLKTLNEIWLPSEGCNCDNIIRKEVIKWINYFREERRTESDHDFMKVFNIEEEDLK